MYHQSIKQKLDAVLQDFDAQDFIQHDQIQVVRKLAEQPGAQIADIELGTIITALLSWGKKEFAIQNATKFMETCEWKPLRYIQLGDFYTIPDNAAIYRVIKGKQFKEVCYKLQQYYRHHESIQKVIKENPNTAKLDDLLETLCLLLEPARLGSPRRNSACKRINLLLRWMVRKDDVDLGLWQLGNIKPSDLYAILDVQVCQQAQRLGLITHYKESWLAVEELTDVYRHWDGADPLKYDFALTTDII